MKRKNLWIALLAVAILAPTVILCVLMMSSEEEITLADLAESTRLMMTDADGNAVVDFSENQENLMLLRKLLSIAQTVGIKSEGALSAYLYTVSSEDGKNSCRLGIDDGQVAVEWKENVYALAYPRLQSADTVLYPSLVRYGFRTENGYIDAPIFSQNADLVYSIDSLDSFRTISLDSSCKVITLEILLYAQGEEDACTSFSVFENVDFDETKAWTLIVNAELIKDGYRVQCGYEFIYSPNKES